MFRYLLTLLVIAAACAGTMYGQSNQNDLDVFGYFQGTFQHQAVKDAKTTNSFSLQQLNLFFSKPLSQSFTAFVNVEMVNSFSSVHSWGDISLEEAWMRYSHSDAFNIKAGLIIPTFNNLNEIKNKTPLLPYIIRPAAYEASIGALIDLEAYTPQRAFVQINGFVPVGDAKLDYAVHVGNSSANDILAKTTPPINAGGLVPGQDTTSFKSGGGRVGIRWNTLKVGGSATIDRDNKTGMRLGHLPRTRLGFDLSYAVAGFTFEGEYVKIADNLDDGEQALLNAIAAGSHGFIRNSFDKQFYFVTLSYDFSDKFFSYAGYSYLDDKSLSYLADGVPSWTAGGGFRPIEDVVVKVQWRNLKVKPIAFEMNGLNAAVSVYF